jgi:hypothetical protein
MSPAASIGNGEIRHWFLILDYSLDEVTGQSYTSLVIKLSHSLYETCLTSPRLSFPSALVAVHVSGSRLAFASECRLVVALEVWWP